MTQAVIYEVTAVVNADLVAEYEDFMRQHHIPDLLATGFFRGATFTRSSENRYRILYEAHDQNSLDKYLQTDAARLRADFAAHFPAGVGLSREVWEIVQQWQTE